MSCYILVRYDALYAADPCVATAGQLRISMQTGMVCSRRAPTGRNVAAAGVSVRASGSLQARRPEPREGAWAEC